jgi:hypothetical protein
MLIHGSDKEKVFDLTIQRTFPYLIFPPIGDSFNGLMYNEFRHDLINKLAALHHYKNVNDDTTFFKLNSEINYLLESAIFDSVTTNEIENYKYEQMTFENALRDFSERIKELETRQNKTEKALERLKKKKLNDNLINRTANLDNIPTANTYIGSGFNTAPSGVNTIVLTPDHVFYDLITQINKENKDKGLSVSNRIVRLLQRKTFNPITSRAISNIIKKPHNQVSACFGNIKLSHPELKQKRMTLLNMYTPDMSPRASLKQFVTFYSFDRTLK